MAAKSGAILDRHSTRWRSRTAVGAEEWLRRGQTKEWAQKQVSCQDFVITIREGRHQFSWHKKQEQSRISPSDTVVMLTAADGWIIATHIIRAAGGPKTHRHLAGAYGRRQATIPERIAYAREPQKLPVVLSAGEVVRFLEAIPSLKSRTALTTVYGVSEVVMLKIADIDSGRMVIRTAAASCAASPACRARRANPTTRSSAIRHDRAADLHHSCDHAPRRTGPLHAIPSAPSRQSGAPIMIAAPSPLIHRLYRPSPPLTRRAHATVAALPTTLSP